MVIKLKVVLSLVAREALKELARDNGSLYAAAVSFFGLLSLLPLMLLATGIIGGIIGSYEEAIGRVVSFYTGIIPVGDQDLERNLRVLSRQPGAMSLLGLAGLLWTGMQVFVILQKVMNLALGTEWQAGYIRKRVIGLALVLPAGALFALSVMISSLLTEAIAAPGPRELLLFAVRFVIIVVTFTLIYKFLPARRIGLDAALVGGLAAGLLFQVAMYAFRWYATAGADFGRTYGSIAGVVVLALWIFYASLILVIGAELTSVYARRGSEASA